MQTSAWIGSFDVSCGARDWRLLQNIVPSIQGSATPSSFGTVGAVLTPNNSVDMDPFAKAIEVSSVMGGATLKFQPVGNADGGWLE